MLLKFFAPVFAFFVPGFQFQDIGPLFAVKIGKIPAFRRILQDFAQIRRCLWPRQVFGQDPDSWQSGCVFQVFDGRPLDGSIFGPEILFRRFFPDAVIFGSIGRAGKRLVARAASQ